ncbi:MAG: arylsulfatase [Verrucomicrobiales bacterium]|nr:arylsulfatase [Verrucomicrobiales bacterium]
MKILLCLLLFGFPLASCEAGQVPNIVHIISDDMGYSDIGCYGGEIETPVLDSLAQSGLRFTNFYVNNMCWPTRASLMTGLYPKTALPKGGSADGGLHPDAVTLPQCLRKAGYATFMSGKWHLSSAEEPDGENAPHHRGFDQYFGTIHGASDFFAPADVQLNGKDMTHEWKDNPDYYYTDVITDYALQFVKQKNPEEKPFYLYVSYNAAHWPLHAKPEDIEHYKGHYAMGWDKLREQRHKKMKELGVIDPEWKLSPRNEKVPAWQDVDNKDWHQKRMEVYAAQITCMDRNIGRIVDYLKESGQFENTLILFHHDNGGCHVEYEETRTGSWTRDFTTDGKSLPVRPGNIPGLMPGPQSTFQSYGYGWANASNTPFRYFKQYDHEGGTRSPLIVSWPKGIDHQKAGGMANAVCHAVDIMPTLLSVAEVALPAQKPMSLEGESVLSSISGGEKNGERSIFWNHNKGRAVRKGNWKLVGIAKKDWELYNLVSDGTELNNVAGDHPDVVNDLKSEFESWAKRTDLGGGKKKKNPK